VVTGNRDAQILDVLRTAGRASVAEIAASLGIGEATVRRALGRLAADGRVIRTYGGAVVADGPRNAPHDPGVHAKRIIGAAAADLVRDGDTIALSSGSTVLELARRIRDRRLTVITNALDVANVLLDAPAIDLVLLGGIVLRGVHSLSGHLAEAALRDLRADTTFMGASAVDMHHGFMTEQIAEIPVDRALRGIAREAVILVDASKFDRVAPGYMFGFGEVQTVVTDPSIRPEIRAALQELGLRLVVGGEASGPVTPIRPRSDRRPATVKP
jgi:DeoR/GlpR family transcriptional regulator of sugar metabolism